MIELTPATLGRIREDVLGMAYLRYEVSHWVVVDHQGRYLESWGRTDFHPTCTSISVAELVQSAAEATGGESDGCGILYWHNHPRHPPYESVLPSAPDLRSLEALRQRLPRWGLTLVDYGVAAPANPGWSWAESVARGEFEQLRAAIFADERRRSCSKR